MRKRGDFSGERRKTRKIANYNAVRMIGVTCQKNNGFSEETATVDDKMAAKLWEKINEKPTTHPFGRFFFSLLLFPAFLSFFVL